MPIASGLPSKINRKLILLTILLIFATFCLSCDFDDKDDGQIVSDNAVNSFIKLDESVNPSTVVEQYINHYYRGELEEAYKLLSSEDKKFLPLEEYKKNEAIKHLQFGKFFEEKMSFRVDPPNIISTKAKVNTFLFYPDFSKVVDDIKNELRIENISPITDSMIAKSINARFQNEQIPFIADSVIFYLINEQGYWVLQFNYKQLITSSKISSLNIKAQNAIHDKKYHEALNIYNEILAYDKSDTNVGQQIHNLEEIIKLKQREDQYTRFIEIIDIEFIEKDKSPSNNSLLAFKIRNNGNENIVFLSIEVSVVDKYGNTVKTQAISPITIFDKHLGPNFSWKLPDGKLFNLDPIVGEHQNVRIRLNVNSVNFEENLILARKFKMPFVIL